jgi:cytochrome c oxidase subunit II
MPIVVKAVSPDEFNQWLVQQGGTPLGAPAAAASATPAPAGGAAVASAAPAPAAPSPAAAPAAAPAAPAPAAAAPAAAPAKLGHDELVANGQKVYSANCVACHQAGGTGMPPAFPPLAGSKVVAGPVEGHINQILKGKNAMPPFASLSDTDIASVATYERNSWGNHSGDVQPAQVTAQRGK